MRQFVADASHELRTPLATVRGYAELYRQGAVPDTAARRVRHGAHRGRVDPDERSRRGPADPGPDRRRARSSRPRRSTSPSWRRMPSPTPACVRRSAASRCSGSTARSHQPWCAARVPAAPGGHQPRRERPAAHSRRHPRRGGRRARRRPASLSRCATTGPGVPDEVATKVFERFYRADPARGRTGGGGSGLGLAIVAAIVAQHHGRVGRGPDPRRRRDLRGPPSTGDSQPSDQGLLHLGRG